MQYTHSLVETIFLGLENNIQFVPIFLGHEPIISRARNMMLHDFITNKEKFDGLLWIDADVSWHPQWAIDIVNSGKDIIGIPLIVKDNRQEHYSLALNFDNLEADQNGLLSVWTMGTGFLYNTYEAVKNIYDQSAVFVEQGIEMRWVFENEYSKDMLLGEDVIYCKKLRELGYEIFIDTTKSLGHIGTATYLGNFPEYLNKVKKELLT